MVGAQQVGETMQGYQGYAMVHSGKSISSGGLHMGLYSKIWRFGAKIHLQQGL
jgi:hypothetical protein